MNTSPCFPSGRADHLPLSNAMVTKLWGHMFLWYLVKYMDNFYFSLHNNDIG